MKFAKMHGLGNNYVYVNLWEEPIPDSALPEIAVAVSNVNTGIGSDGLITIGPSTVGADARMRIFNADGSEGQTCGNGLRCVGKYLYEKKLSTKKNLHIETKAGPAVLELHVSEAEGQVHEITVDMGEPRLKKSDLPMQNGDDSTALREPIQVDGKSYQFTGVSMGNPHAVFFVENVNQVDVAGIGPKIETHEFFPERVNVEFVHVLSSNEMDFRVWERGSGITQACGSGACASVVAGVLENRLTRGQEVMVHLAGGDLAIKWADDNHVYMRGPATWICEGEWMGASFI